MHCGSVQIDCRRCLRAKVSSLSVEIQRGDVVFTAYAYEHGAVLNPFGCVVSHTLDCSPCFPRNIAALRWLAEGNTRAHRDRHWRGGIEFMVLFHVLNVDWRRVTTFPIGTVRTTFIF